MNFVYRSYIGHFCIWHQNSGHFTKFCHSWQNFGLYYMRRVENVDHIERQKQKDLTRGIRSKHLRRYIGIFPWWYRATSWVDVKQSEDGY